MLGHRQHPSLWDPPFPARSHLTGTVPFFLILGLLSPERERGWSQGGKLWPLAPLMPGYIHRVLSLWDDAFEDLGSPASWV